MRRRVLRTGPHEMQTRSARKAKRVSICTQVNIGHAIGLVKKLPGVFASTFYTGSSATVTVHAAITIALPIRGLALESPLRRVLLNSRLVPFMRRPQN